MSNSVPLNSHARSQTGSTVKGWLSQIPAWLVSLLILIILLALAEVGARTGYISRLVLPAPSAVASILWEDLTKHQYLFGHFATSLQSTVIGFILGAIVAILTAGVLAMVHFLEKVMTPFVVAFQSMPKIALAPLIVLWFGFGRVSEVVIVMAVCFFPIMVNTLQGLRIRDRDHYELFKSLGASRYQMFIGLRVPHAVPYIFAGLHLGIIFALIGTVVAEFVGTNSGLGYAMLAAKASFDVPRVYACMVLLMLMGVGLNLIMEGVERRVAFWVKDVST